MAKKEKSEEVVKTINVFQACNHFQLNGRNRRVAEKKYYRHYLNVDDWEKTLSDDKLL